MTDLDPSVRPPTPPVPRDDGAAGRKVFLAVLEPNDEEFFDLDAAPGPLREVDLSDDQDRGSEPGRR